MTNKALRPFVIISFITGLLLVYVVVSHVLHSPLSSVLGDTTTSAIPSPTSEPVLPSVLNIAMLGDGFAVTMPAEIPIANRENDFALLLQKDFPSSSVLDLGRSGWTTTEVISGIDRQPSQLLLALKQKPDVALVETGTTDVFNLYQNAKADPDKEQNLSAFKDHLQSLLCKLTANSIITLVATIPDPLTRPVNLQSFLAPIVVDMRPQLQSQVINYNSAIQAVALTCGAQVVDLSSSPVFTSEAMLTADGSGPNRQGYSALSRLWIAALAKMRDSQKPQE